MTLKKPFELKKNALEKDRVDVLDAAHQLLKIVCPKIYQRLVGPLNERKRDPKYVIIQKACMKFVRV